MFRVVDQKSESVTRKEKILGNKTNHDFWIERNLTQHESLC